MLLNSCRVIICRLAHLCQISANLAAFAPDTPWKPAWLLGGDMKVEM